MDEFKRRMDSGYAFMTQFHPEKRPDFKFILKNNSTEMNA
jgi:hypothetical protein